jgi:hypothetical protein
MTLFDLTQTLSMSIVQSLWQQPILIMYFFIFQLDVLKDGGIMKYGELFYCKIVARNTSPIDREQTYTKHPHSKKWRIHCQCMSNSLFRLTRNSNVYLVYISITLSRESLLKGKDQYNRRPCTNQHTWGAFRTETLFFFFFTKQTT